MKNSNSESFGKMTAPYLSKLKNVFYAVNDHQYTSLEKKKMFKQYKYMICYLLTSPFGLYREISDRGLDDSV